MFKEQIQKTIKKILQEEQINLKDFSLEPSSFGDYSSNVALRIGKHESYQSPLEIAKFLQPKLEKDSLFEKVNVSEPGFINFFLDQKKTVELTRKIIQQGNTFGANKNKEGKKARVEFVSANPTGPLHIGNARGGPLGDCIASVLEFNGYKVLREYINNDQGNQISELGKTLAVKAGFIKLPEEELTYRGEYTNRLAKEISAHLDKENKKEEEIIKEAGKMGTEMLLKDILNTCQQMGINFDLVVSETSLQKELPEILAELEKKGVLKKADGAVWFAPKSSFLKDREAVVVKSDGSYTYFAADIAYHREKFKSKADLIIDVFGSNTSGHVPKLLSLAQVENFDINNFKIILYQFVRLKRGKEIVEMSKRSGNFVTAAEVLEEVGADAFRFFILSHAPGTHIDFDLELAKEKSNDNPVYYVQYAHARMASILAKFNFDQEEVNYNLLKEKEELDLIKKLAQFPDLIVDLEKSLAVQKLTFFALEIAEKFHHFYEKHQVLNQEKELTKARGDLVRATKITLQNSLKLLGISAPERM